MTPEVEAGSGESEAEWVAPELKLDEDLVKERRGELLDEKALEAVKKAFDAALGQYGDAGAISASKLAERHPMFAGNPLARRIMESFSEAGDGTLTRDDWVAACVVLSPGGSRANKARTAFWVYDLDGDGVVDEDDLRGTLVKVLGNALSANQVEQLVQRLMRTFDANHDRRLTEAEFRALLSKEDYEDRFTVELH